VKSYTKILLHLTIKKTTAVKKLLFLLLIAPLFFISSCEEEKGPIHGCLDSQACNYNPEATLDNNSCEYAIEGYDCDGNITEYIVGMEAEGGIVFYLDETGEHGLVAALEDLEGLYEWGCVGKYVNGADRQAIGTGYQNTLNIINQGCTTYNGGINGGITAAQAALDAEINGYSDWYLPSKDELVEMNNAIGYGSPEGNIGGFSIYYYWSSTGGGNYGAWYVSFPDGNTGAISKTNPGRVRVIRAF